MLKAWNFWSSSVMAREVTRSLPERRDGSGISLPFSWVASFSSSSCGPWEDGQAGWVLAAGRRSGRVGADNGMSGVVGAVHCWWWGDMHGRHSQ